MLIPARPINDESPKITDDEWMKILRERFTAWSIWRSNGGTGDWYGTHHMQLTKAEEAAGYQRTVTAAHARELAAAMDQEEQRRVTA